MRHLFRCASSRTLVALLLAASGCAAHPLGEDWPRLDAPAREQRAVEVLSALIEGGLDGAGAPFVDRQAVRADATGVSYEVEGRPARLRWQDVTAVESTPHTALPTRPETVFLYVDPDAAGLGAVADLVRPPLMGLGLARPYVQLRSRPAWSRNRIVQALRTLAKRRQAEPATPTAARTRQPPAEAATAPAARAAPARAAPAAALDAVEAKLRRLREWREQGLIDEDEYQGKRRELLERL